MPGCWILSLHLLFQLNNNLVKNKIMKKLIINKCMELVTTYNKDLSQRDIDKIRYGLEGLYLTS